MDETPPKVLDLVQQLEDSLTRAKEASGEAAKDNPDAGPGFAHDFNCTHDPCVCVSGEEHPSGLRDDRLALIKARNRVCSGGPPCKFGAGCDWCSHAAMASPVIAELVTEIERLRAWLSVVSEGAEFRQVGWAKAGLLVSCAAMEQEPPNPESRGWVPIYLRNHAASRGVLVPRIESDENGGTK